MAERRPCVRCGRTIDGYARICPFCNWDQDAPVPAVETQPAEVPAYVPPAERSWRKYVFGAAGAAVTILLMFVIGVALQRRKNVTPPTPKDAGAITETAAPTPKPAIQQRQTTNVTLVPDNGGPVAANDAYTSAPVSDTAQGLASQTDRTDATAVSSSEYQQIAQRAAAEAAQRKKMSALIDPRSVTGQPYGSAPVPPRRAPVTTAAQLPPMTSASGAFTPAARAVVRTAAIPEQQPLPRIRVRENVTASVEVTIGPDGRVTDVNVLQPLPGGETAKLVGAVQNWRFKPATENGVPVASRFRTTLFFHADGR